MVEGIAREIRAEDQRYVLDVLRIYCEHDKRRTAITRTSDDWYKAKISAVTEIAKLFKDHPL
jgi:hypothetical protein